MPQPSDNCIFCRIITHESPGKILYQDQQLSAFRDTHPVAPTHVLIVPNQHIASINDLEPEDEILIGKMFSLAHQIAIQEGVDQSGYRMIINNGPHAGQAVFHLHLHVIGGQRMRYPMG